MIGICTVLMGLGLWLGRTPDRAKTGAVVLGVLSVLVAAPFLLVQRDIKRMRPIVDEINRIERLV